MNSNLSVVRQEGFKALSKELGIAGTAIFIRQFEAGYGNYTEERDELLKDVTMEEIVARIQERKRQAKEEPVLDRGQSEAATRNKSDLLLPPTLNTKNLQLNREEANER